VESEPGDVLEHRVGREERHADVDCRGSDPQVVGVNRFVKRMADLTAGVTKLRRGRQQGITDRRDCGG